MKDKGYRLDDVPVCEKCNRLKNIETLAGTWLCYPCEPSMAERIIERTKELLALRQAILDGTHKPTRHKKK